ncbi:hypothetical protein EDB86DRAFT_2979821, partial [Lactarius hatsudake]
CFLITVPLTGTLVRLRANYNPKGLQLDPEDGVQPHTGPVITSLFLMLSRVRSLEVGSVVFHSLDWLSRCIDPGLGWPYEGHGSIITPYQLPYFRPLHSLRVLLTPTERRKPWVLYLTPGLFAADFCT